MFWFCGGRKGTSDEHLAIVENLREGVAGVEKKEGRAEAQVVLVTSPQAVALADVRKELNFVRKAHLPILGIVENLSGYACPHCSVSSSFFPIPFLLYYFFTLSYFSFFNFKIKKTKEK
jgi:Mrp family chromosome partitioning ATPase